MSIVDKIVLVLVTALVVFLIITAYQYDQAKAEVNEMKLDLLKYLTEGIAV